MADRRPDLGVFRLDPLDEVVGEGRDQRHRDQCDQRELPVENEHDRGDAEHHRGEPKHGVHPTVEELFEPVDVVREDRHHLAGLLVGEEVHVEPLHLVVGVGPNGVLDVLRKGVPAPVTTVVEDGTAEEGERYQPDQQPELRRLGRREPRLGHRQRVEGERWPSANTESIPIPSNSGGRRSSIRASRLATVPTAKENQFSRPYSENNCRIAFSVPSRCSSKGSSSSKEVLT